MGMKKREETRVTEECLVFDVGEVGVRIQDSIKEECLEII